MLDTPSAGRFAAASREGQRFLLTRLVKEKAALDAAAQAAQAAQPQAAPRRITFSAAGRAFIDEYVDAFRAAAPPQRRQRICCARESVRCDVYNIYYMR